MDLESGHTWQRIDPQPVFEQGVNRCFKVERTDDPSQLGYFKYPDLTSPHSSMYSLGAERAAVRLAEELGVAVRPTHLEVIEHQRGLLSIEAPGVAWADFDADLFDQVTFVDKDLWARYVVVDIWLANIDRHPGNLFVEADPPQRRPEDGDACALWLIDFGHSGLWPLWKWTNPPNSLADITQAETLVLAPRYVNHLRSQMPPQYRMAFPRPFDDRRGQAIDFVRRIPDHQIEGALREIPTDYMNAHAVEQTFRLLAARRDHIDSLVSDIFPV